MVRAPTLGRLGQVRRRRRRVQQARRVADVEVRLLPARNLRLPDDADGPPERVEVAVAAVRIAPVLDGQLREEVCAHDKRRLLRHQQIRPAPLAARRHSPDPVCAQPVDAEPGEGEVCRLFGPDHVDGRVDPPQAVHHVRDRVLPGGKRLLRVDRVRGQQLEETPRRRHEAAVLAVRRGGAARTLERLLLGRHRHPDRDCVAQQRRLQLPLVGKLLGVPLRWLRVRVCDHAQRLQRLGRLPRNLARRLEAGPAAREEPRQGDAAGAAEAEHQQQQDEDCGEAEEVDGRRDEDAEQAEDWQPRAQLAALHRPGAAEQPHRGAQTHKRRVRVGLDRVPARLCVATRGRRGPRSDASRALPRLDVCERHLRVAVAHPGARPA
mmetsp:Transcript_32618/g.107859  ORF Transcript_32618/g.107859 Transcript_32618/m.107859 type:complete len:379 (+) Transcript_32618:1285-2421(+)